MSGGSSLYRTVEDSESRLVLRGRKFALWFLSFFLLGNAVVLLYVGLFVTSRRQLFPVIAGSLLGAFFALCGGAALVWAIRYRSLIEVDRQEKVVRFRSGAGTSTAEIPFARIASIVMERHRRRRSVEYQVFLVDFDEREWLIDRSTDGEAMAALRDRFEVLTRDRTGGQTARGSGAGAVETPFEADSPPAGISIEPSGGASLYTWRTLPRSAFWVVFWGLLTLMLGGSAVLLLFGATLETVRQPLAHAVILLGFVGVTVALMYWVARRMKRRGTVSLGIALAAVLLANFLLGTSPAINALAAGLVLAYLAGLCAYVVCTRCRLRVSPEGLAYDEHILGWPLGWRRHSVPAGEIESLRIRSAVRGGGGIEVRARGRKPFTLMIPQGSGAFSRRDLEWLRNRWWAVLRLRSSSRSPGARRKPPSEPG